MVDERADLERRLDAGEWLRLASVAKLLGIGRTTVHTLLATGKIGYRLTPGPGRYRECNPADVRKLLDEYRQEHRGQ